MGSQGTAAPGDLLGTATALLCVRQAHCDVSPLGLALPQATGLLPFRVDKEDVMTCLIKGCNFVLKNIPHEAFMYQKDSDPEFRFQTNHPNIFPYLLVNIGSGVSIVKVRLPFPEQAVAVQQWLIGKCM